MGYITFLILEGLLRGASFQLKSLGKSSGIAVSPGEGWRNVAANYLERLFVTALRVGKGFRSSEFPNYAPERHPATDPLTPKATQPASQTDRQPGHPARHGFRGSGPGANMAPEYVKNVGQNHLDTPPRKS